MPKKALITGITGQYQSDLFPLLGKACPSLFLAESARVPSWVGRSRPESLSTESRFFRLPEFSKRHVCCYEVEGARNVW